MKLTLISLLLLMIFTMTPHAQGQIDKNFIGLTDTSAFDRAPSEDAVWPHSSADRDAIVSRAETLLTDVDLEGRSLLEGPHQYTYKSGQLERLKYREFTFNQKIDCQYLEPWKTDKLGGKTPKFNCLYTYGKRGQMKTKKLKVKYDSLYLATINNGLYGEIFGTRLLWSLGFPADTALPVQLRCLGCPEDPWTLFTSYWLMQSGEQQLSTLDPKSKAYAEARQNFVLSQAQLIAQTLTAYEKYSKVRVRAGIGKDVYEVYLPSGELLFSTVNGELRLEDVGVFQTFEPGSQRFKKADHGGYQDLAFITYLREILKDSTKVSRDFVSATIEWKHNSIPIETYAKEGWTFNTSSRDKPGHTTDIRNVTPHNRELQLQREELALLASFISHADNKAEQQRLICMDPEKIEVEKNDCESASQDPRQEICAAHTDIRYSGCERPMLMIQDVGFIMGFGGVTKGRDNNGDLIFDRSPEAQIYSRMNIDGYLRARIFKDEVNCITNINRWASGVDINEVISEEARLRLTKKLQKLADNDQDLTDLFRSIRLHLLDAHIRGEAWPQLDEKPSQLSFAGGDREQALIEQWKTAFRSKVQILASRHCNGR